MKKRIIYLVLCVIILLTGCSLNHESNVVETTNKKSQKTTQSVESNDGKRTLSIQVPEEWEAYFGSISGFGIHTDFNEATREISGIAADNIVDTAFFKELDDDLKSKDWSAQSQREIVGKYLDIWKAEWDASDKRINKLFKEQPLNKYVSDPIDYNAIKEAYKNNKEVTEEYIKEQSKIYSTIWSEDLSRENLDLTSVMVLNLYKKAAINSFQIEECLGGSFEFIYEPEK